jgi:hypothetical protein
LFLAGGHGATLADFARCARVLLMSKKVVGNKSATQ